MRAAVLYYLAGLLTPAILAMIVFLVLDLRRRRKLKDLGESEVVGHNGPIDRGLQCPLGPFPLPPDCPLRAEQPACNPTAVPPDKTTPGS